MWTSRAYVMSDRALVPRDRLLMEGLALLYIVAIEVAAQALSRLDSARPSRLGYHFIAVAKALSTEVSGHS